MNVQIFRRTVVLIACTMLLLSPVGAATISFLPSAVTVQHNDSTEVSLVLDEAPSGLYSYDLAIGLSPPENALITDVRYPSWASQYSNTTAFSDGGVRIRASDLAGQVGANETGIILANLTVRGTTVGMSSILLESGTVLLDKGIIVHPILMDAQVNVTKNTSTGSEGTVAYSDPTPTVTVNNSSNLTTLPAKTTNETALNTSPVATGSPSVQTTTRTSGTALPAGGGPGAGGNDSLYQAASENPGEEQGIPWMWFLGGVVLICAIVPVAFFLHRKRKRDL